MATILSDILKEEEGKKKETKTKKGELEIVYRFGDSLAVCKGGTFPYLLLPDLSV